MADISKITIESGTYDVKDETARQGNINLSNKIKLINNLYLGAFFNEYDSNRIVIAISKDTKNWQQLVKTNMYGRDPSILYKDGYFYIAITHTTVEHDFRIYKTANFIDFTTHDVDMHFLNYHSRWAPEFFVDKDNTIKVLLNVKETENGLFKNYIGDINLDTFTVTNITNITPDNDLSQIDAQILYENNMYYLCVADQTTEHLSKVKIYQSATIGNWQLINNNVFKTFYFVEGACLLKTNNRFLIYADSPLLNPYLLVETSNLGVSDSIGQARDGIQPIKTLWDHRHGTITYVNNNEEKEIIYNIIEQNNIDINFIENPPVMNSILVVNNEDFDNLYIEEKTIIYVNGNGGTIGKIWNPFRVEDFTIAFYGEVGAHLIIENIQNVEGDTVEVNHDYEVTSNNLYKVVKQNCERTCSKSL